MSAAAEVEVDDHDNESGYGDEGSTTSYSIESHIYTYEEKYGRTYQNYSPGSYIYPNDEREQERLNFVHNTYTLALQDRLCLAPIESDKRILDVLDIGTGTGIWAIDFGDKYPHASVCGVDLSPIQPEFVPPNVRFYVEDVEQDWLGSSYDFIHCRSMAGSIANWPTLVDRIYSHLKPGGWVELQETINRLYSEDNSLKADNALVKLMDNLKKAHDKIGRMLDPAPSFKKWLEQAGFHHVTVQIFKLPIGMWPEDDRLKAIGACMAQNFVDGVDAFTAKPLRDYLHWSAEKVEILNMEVRDAVKNVKVHAMFDFVVVTAQKPKRTPHS